MKKPLLLLALLFATIYGIKLWAQPNFAPPSNYSVSTAPGFSTLKSADFNNDGYKDIIGVFSGDKLAKVMLNKGDGTFEMGQTYNFVEVGKALTVGDYNMDGLTDFAVVTGPVQSFQLDIYLNNPITPGTFSLSNSYPNIPTSSDLETIDFNNDGISDLVNVGTSNGLTFFQNDGHGVFTKINSVNAGETPWDAVIADIDADGYNDIILSSQYAQGEDFNIVKIFKNDQAGNFTMSNSYAAGTSGAGLDVKDINHDGKPDIVSADYNNHLMYILLNNGSGGFTFQNTINTGQSSGNMSLVINDFDMDGYNDIITCFFQGNQLAIFTNTASSPGTFNAATPIATLYPWSIISEDFNKDGKPDVAVLELLDGLLSVYLNTTTSALPVNLKTFTGTLVNGKAHLRWTSGIESNFEAYEIEKSLDGTSFNKIGSQVGKGNDITYHFSIRQNEAVNQYRLKLLNSNGTFKYSDIITLNNPQATNRFRVTPNPAINFIHINMKAAAIFHMYDASGKMIQTVRLHTGDNKIDIHKLSPGVYFGVIGSSRLKFIKR